jgi:hypothetical protein
MLTSLRECPPDRKAFIKLLADHIHRNGPSALAAFAERAQRELGEGKERWSWSGKYNDGLRFRFEMKPLTEDELERFSTAGRTPPVYNAEFEIITDKRNPKGWEGNAKFSFHYFGRPVNEADRELLNQSRSDKDKVVWVQGGKFKGAK